MSFRQLSRLSITNHINENTPLCTLLEIADAHGIKYNESDFTRPNFSHHLIENIFRSPVPHISINEAGKLDIKNNAELRYLARFINKYVNWPQSKLIEAYNFITLFIENKHDDPFTLLPDNFVFGLQTPDQVRSINACILYSICNHYRLTLNAHTTINQMAYAVRLLRVSTSSLYRRAIHFIEKDAKRTDLINVLMMAPYEIKDPRPDFVPENRDVTIIPKNACSHEMLKRLHTALNNVKTLQEKMDPGTDNGAIALAALNYGIDISKCSDPLVEYKFLKISGRTEYKPVDHWMHHWYNINPSLFDLSVTYNPLFPIEYYNPIILNKMAKSQGFSDGEILNSSPHELLQLAYVSDTFFLGPMPCLKSETTAIDLDDISDIEYGELLCYGQIENPLQPVSIHELIGLFNANQNFTNPFQDESVFSTTAINKLKIILQSPNGPCPFKSLSSDTIRARNELIDVITLIEISISQHDEPTREFLFTYRISSTDTKQAIVKTFTQLLHIGMYMRGWRGPNTEYPVVRAEVPTDLEHVVAINVTNAIANYESSCRSLGKIGVQLNALPLVKYRENQYQISKSASDGFTIGERIAIIKQGDDTHNIASCIRLSSNWICATAHKYITALNQPPPFDIFNLRLIA